MILIWLFSINLILFFTTLGMEEAAGAAAESGAETIELYGIFGGIFVAIGVVVVMQGAIIGEKKAGTAAWVLSKPVSRSAFVVAKLIANTAGMILTAILLPGVVAYIEIALLTSAGWLPPLPFLAGLGVLTVNMLFWLTLTLMLGALFESWGPVIAIPLAFAFGQQMLAGLVPALLHVFPWTLSSPLGEENPSLAVSLITGGDPFSWMPFFAALAFSVLFVAVAILRFNRQEF
jgi:ABC-2 type transport system permease protein